MLQDCCAFAMQEILLKFECANEDTERLGVPLQTIVQKVVPSFQERFNWKFHEGVSTVIAPVNFWWGRGGGEAQFVIRRGVPLQLPYSEASDNEDKDKFISSGG